MDVEIIYDSRDVAVINVKMEIDDSYEVLVSLLDFTIFQLHFFLDIKGKTGKY
jgi:hypothetical protein